MSSEALSKAILANPDDDLPRLVYADWLEENGKADTAAFIRVQCELTRLPMWDPLWIRCHLLDKSWLTGRNKSPSTPVAPPGFRWSGDRYRRGFPCRVRVPQPTVAAVNADGLFRTAPVDCYLFDMPTRRDITPLFEQPTAANIRRVEFNQGGLGPDHLRPLIDSPHAHGITALQFEFRAVGEQGLRAVLVSPVAGQLRELCLRSNFFRQWDDPLLTAFQGVQLPQLESLTLANEELTASSLRRLLDSADLPRLHDLSVGVFSLREEGMRLLTSQGHRTMNG